MARPVTLFTGQWADLPLEELAEKAPAGASTGSSSPAGATTSRSTGRSPTRATAPAQRALLERHGLQCWALGAHLVGQAVCDPIDERHRGILPPEVWGDGDPEGVRRRAAERMKDTARAAAALGVTQVNGFTGSPVWHLLYSFPPNDFAEIERGYEDFAERWGPILDVFDAEGVRFGLEVHPTEIAYDFVTTAQGARRDRPARGVRDQPRPEPLRAPVPRPRRVRERVRRPHLPRARQGLEAAPRRPAQHPRLAPELRRRRDRGWDFVSPGHGDVDFESFFRALNRIGYAGPALDRVGGLGHGSRVGRAGRARLRPPRRLRARRRSSSTRRCRRSA